jgi:hypothetical protein
VTLTTADGRVWRFTSIDTPQAKKARLVSAGDAIGAASAPLRVVGIELWQNAHGVHRLSDRWNPLVFLDFRPARPATPYPGDNAPQASIAQWMGAMAQARGLPPELPVMAGLLESGLKNINFGDGTTGFFGMRLAIWNQGAYAGYPDNPELQVRWFLDQAIAVKEQRIAAGLSVSDPNQYGNWVADVERPAEQYRGRYQLQLDRVSTCSRATGRPRRSLRVQRRRPQPRRRRRRRRLQPRRRHQRKRPQQRRRSRSSPSSRPQPAARCASPARPGPPERPPTPRSPRAASRT